MDFHKPKIKLEDELNNCKTMDDLCGKNGLMQRLLGNMIEQLLEKEMDEHIGYAKHAIEGHNSGNSRNGKNAKIVQSSYGPIEIETPRDRTGEFEPQIVKKRQKNISSFDDKIISMYAKGMSTRDIQNGNLDLFTRFILSSILMRFITKSVKMGRWL
jgi:putative transposase